LNKEEDLLRDLLIENLESVIEYNMTQKNI